MQRIRDAGVEDGVFPIHADARSLPFADEFFDAAKKVVAKDDSPGPSCDLTFTPKEAGKYTLEVRNLGPGDNRSTLKVALDKKEGKEERPSR